MAIELETAEVWLDAGVTDKNEAIRPIGKPLAGNNRLEPGCGGSAMGRLKGELEMKEQVQRTGAFMAGMITPNPGTLIDRGMNMDDFITL